MSTPSDSNPPPQPNACGTSACGGRWKLPVLLAVVLAAIVVFRMTGNRDAQVNNVEPATGNAAVGESPTGQTVALTIRFADGNERKFDAVAWREGMTVDDLLTTVSRMPEGVSYAMRGNNAMSFLTRIDETRNEGPRGRNWTYSVNGVRADRSFAVYPLRPGDHVLWTFAEGE